MNLVFRRKVTSIIALTVLGFFMSILATGLIIIIAILFNLQNYLSAGLILASFPVVFILWELHFLTQTIKITNDTITFQNIFSSTKIPFNKIISLSQEKYTTNLLGVAGGSVGTSLIRGTIKPNFMIGYHLKISYKDSQGRVSRLKKYITDYTHEQKVIEILNKETQK